MARISKKSTPFVYSIPGPLFDTVEYYNLKDLDEAEEQYNMGFRSQVAMMNEMLDVHGAR